MPSLTDALFAFVTAIWLIATVALLLNIVCVLVAWAWQRIRGLNKNGQPSER